MITSISVSLALLALSPGGELNLAQAKQSFCDGNYAATLKILEAESAAEPRPIAATTLYAETLWRVGDVEAATKQFGKAAQANPKDAAALEGLGRCLTRLGKLEKAELVLAKAAKLNPEAATILCSQGALQLARGELVTAENTLLAARDYAPEDSRSTRTLINVMLADDDPKAAMAIAKEFCEEQSTDPAGPCLEGILHWKQDDLDAAAAAFQRALVLDPDCLEAHQHLAVLGTKTLTLKKKGYAKHGPKLDASEHFQRYFDLGGRSLKVKKQLTNWKTMTWKAKGPETLASDELAEWKAKKMKAEKAKKAKLELGGGQ